MDSFLSGLGHAVEGTPLIAALAAFLWGVLSIVLSPCHLASLPLIVAFIDRQGPVQPRRAVLIATLFATGILATIAAIGIATALAGRLLGDIGAAGNWIVAAVFFAFGLHLLDVIPLPIPGRGSAGLARKGPLAAFVLGLVFGIALGPCTFAYMAPMLAVAFRVGSTETVRGALLLLAFGLGHCTVIVVAGASASLVQRYLDWDGRARSSVWMRRVCGVCLLLGGLWLLWTAP